MARVKKQHQIDENTVIYQTNCLYTEDGQVVVVRFLDDGNAQFEDVSRMMYGVVESCNTAEEVEQAYLHSRYTTDIDYAISRELRTLGREHKHEVPCDR